MSEPAFAARPGATAEDDGWLLVWVVNLATERAEIEILDAATLAPVATLDAGGFLGLASHARFVSEG